MTHVLRLVLVAQMAFGAIVFTGCGTVAADGSAPLPYYDGPDFTPHWSPIAHRVSDFRLTTQRGETLTGESLRGRIHVASFVYTKCAAVCPVLVRDLAKVQAAIATLPDVVLVSYTVTPEADTPAALAAFGRERSIDPDRWRLVTGDRRQIWRLARESYFADDPRALDGEPSPEQAFLHTEKVLLVDRHLHLRGVYNGTSAFDIEHLITDLRRLASSPEN